MREQLFKTERLFFSSWTEADDQLAERLWGNQEVTRFITKEARLSQKQVLQRLASEIESQKKFGFQYWPIFLREDALFVGCCGLHMYDKKNQIAELGVHLLPSAWGKGLAMEAANGVIDYATQETTLIMLFAGHHPDNHASGNLLKKLGFKFQGRFDYEPTGLAHPSYLRTLRRDLE